MSKKILILDDMETRHRVFRRNYIGHILTHVYTADDAIKALTEEKFDVVFLDRDLDEHAMMGLTPLEKTGEDVVQFIVEKMDRDKWPSTFVVHSWNPDAADRMVDKLKEAGAFVVRKPFSERI